MLKSWGPISAVSNTNVTEFRYFNLLPPSIRIKMYDFNLGHQTGIWASLHVYIYDTEISQRCIVISLVITMRLSSASELFCSLFRGGCTPPGSIKGQLVAPLTTSSYNHPFSCSSERDTHLFRITSLLYNWNCLFVDTVAPLKSETLTAVSMSNIMRYKPYKSKLIIRTPISHRADLLLRNW
jgi:hypothetical protein